MIDAVGCQIQFTLCMGWAVDNWSNVDKFPYNDFVGPAIENGNRPDVACLLSFS